MQTRPLLRRLFFGAYLLVGGGLAVLMPPAEARAEAASLTAQPHVEEPSDRPCAAAHDHLTCTVCRALRLLGRRETTASFMLQPSTVAMILDDRASADTSKDPHGGRQSRAPPAL